MQFILLHVFICNLFLKDYGKTKLSDKHYEKFIKFVSLLLEDKKLPSEALDHELVGNYIGFRECHISSDMLLIYIIEDGYLKLTRIGTHNQLFNN
ncbi:type II toxin-antitoxin system YafQ family toxin [Aliarcobacter lanthieri]|uniref:type II toxin-antitoxin system YafQ family toxin n=1 Tax=Aliarcobacter lanthieri TaxID=1355374 RepID=UPI003AA7C323